MTAALVALGLAVAGLAVTAALAWRSAAASKDTLVARTAQLAEQQVQAGEIQSTLVKQRDEEHAARTAAETQVADLMTRLLRTETQLAELAAKYAREKLARIAAQPPSQDGADAVNELFEQPLPGKEKL